MAVKTNSEYNKVIKGTNKADTITNTGYYVTIDGGKGNDSISNEGSSVSINGGAGKDTIINGRSDSEVEISVADVTINAGANDDSIINTGSDILFNYSGGNDYIEGFNEKSTLKIASGTMNSVINSNGIDLFLTVGKNVVTLAGAASYEKVNIVNSKGKAIKYNVKANFNVTEGNDSLTNYVPKIKIDALGGDDTIHSIANKVTLDGGAGKDSIISGKNDSEGWLYTEEVAINGGTGDDTIKFYSTKATIDAGTGNDYILGESPEGDSKFMFVYSGGNDTIYGVNDDSTIKIASGTMNSIVNSDGENYFLSVGENTITVANHDDYYLPQKLNVVDSKGKAVKFTVKPNINFTEGKDSVTNLLSDVTLDALGGEDYIYNGGSNVSIFGGKGNDTICNGIVVSDLFNIWNYAGESLTLDGGEGNDYIASSAEKALIKYSGGNDKYYLNLAEGLNTLQIASGTMNSVVNLNGSDLFVTVGENVITLESAAYYADKLNIIDSTGKTIKFKIKADFKATKGNDSISNILDNVTIKALGGNDDIYNSGSNVIIDGGDGKDTIINNDGSNVSIVGGKGDDYISNNNSYDEGSNVTIDGGAGNDSIDNSGSNVSIVGGAGNDYIISDGSNVTIDGGAGNDYIDNNSYNSKKVLFNYSGGNDYITGFDATSTLKIASGTLDSVVVTNGQDLFLTVGKNIITLASVVDNYYEDDGEVGDGENFNIDKLNIVDSKGKAIKLTLKTKITGTDGNDYLSNSVDGATIDGGKGRNDIYNSGENVLFQYSGGNDYISGFDATSTLKIASGTMNSVVNSDGYNYFLDVGKNSITLSGAADLQKVNVVNSKDKAIKFKVQEVNSVYNYTNKEKLNGTKGRDLFSNVGEKASINSGDGSDTIDNYGNYSTLLGGKGDDLIYNNEEKVSINGGDGSDTINNSVNGNYATLLGGKGNDLISNSGSNVSINAGKGNDTVEISGDDTFIYANGDGNDVITGTTSNVTIKLTNISKVSESLDEDNYNSAVFKVGKGSITVENALLYEKNITFVDKNNKTISSYTCSSDGIANGKSITLSASYWGDFDATNFTKVDGSKTYGITISGGNTASTLIAGEGYDTIKGGKGNDKLYGNGGADELFGGAGKDSLWGGADDDSLYGGDDNDTFIYKPGEGTDTIFDYTSGDMLKILKSNGKTGGTFTDSAFSNGSLTLTISGGGSVIFDNVAKGDKFNINGKTYTLGESKLN